MNMPHRRKTLTTEDAHAVWDLLVSKAGAREDERDAFTHYMTTAGDQHEFRFCGLLGFGGKLYFDNVSGAWVSCYREDEDDIRRVIVGMVNRHLHEIVPPWDTLVREAAGMVEPS